MSELFVTVQTLFAFYSFFGFMPGKDLNLEGGVVSARDLTRHDLRDHGFMPLIQSGIIPAEFLWKGIMIAPTIPGEFIAAFVTIVTERGSDWRYADVDYAYAYAFVCDQADTIYAGLIKDFGGLPTGLVCPEALKQVAARAICFLCNSPKGWFAASFPNDELDDKVEELLKSC